MDLTGVPTPKMDWEASNLPEQWKKFRTHVDLIFKGPLEEKSEEIKVTYLLLWVGDKGREIYNTWTGMTNDEKKKLEPHYKRYLAHVQPKLNPIFARFKFNNENQGASTVEQFVTRLRVLAEDCNYGNSKDEMIRDRIVFGTSSQKVREKLIAEGEKLTLEKAIQIAQSHEYSQEQLKTMSGQEVHAVSHSHNQNTRKAGRSSPSQNAAKDTERRRPPQARPKHHHKTKTQECDRCGYDHSTSAKCPAKGKQCKSCNRWDHFAKKCFSKTVACHELQTLPEQSDSEPEFFIDIIETNHNHDQAFCNLFLGSDNTPIKFKLDTGSQVNIIPRHVLISLGLSHMSDLKQTDQKLSAYNGNPLRSLGCFELNCTYKGQSRSLTFHVVETTSPPILGMRACLDFGLIKLVYSCNLDTTQDKSEPLVASQVMVEFSEVFEGIGLFQGECSIHTDPAVHPTVHPPRRVPLALQDKLKNELERMESLNIIQKVTEPTQWVSSLVVVEKPNGKLRVCLDPKDLNRAILRPHYPMKTLEDVLPQLSKARFFTKLDARSGYWTIKLSEASSYLTTFNTPFGRYRYLRLPFGLKSSQDEFQRKIDECYEGLDGVVALVDDLLVFGQTREEHDRNLRKVLIRSKERGVKLNKDKLEVGVTKVKYFGHLLTSEGVGPDPDKVSAVREMKPPKDKSELETFLGMVTYLAKFAPNLSEITSPLRNLLAKDVLFQWDSAQSKAFDKVKDLITSSPSPVLAYFDPRKVTTLQCDASKYGLGAALMQEGKPVAFASKSLTQSEVQYAQIEKEMFAILFGCKRFHQYIYGRKVKVETDHKPLIPIFKKALFAAPPRLQRMLLQLQNYDLEVDYIPGKQIPVADSLSRNFVDDTFPGLSKDMEAQVHSVLANLPISDRKLKEIETESDNDKQFQLLKHTILNGWPECRRDCPPQIIEFWNHRDELSVTNGILLKGTKVLIPRSLRAKILECIHIGHMGIEKSLQRARTSVFWPKISSDIAELVSNCNVCLKHRYSNPKQPLQPHPVPDYPWQVVATDLFLWDNKDFLIVTDYYSRHFEVIQLRDTKSKTIIQKLKSIFARLGIPQKVVSDNGPQYSSQEFANFSKEYDFIHATSSPRYPQSNGLAEKSVQIAKRIFEKAELDGRDPYLGILEYRTTPLEVGYSPAELLQGRQLRSILPTLNEQLLPKVIDHEKVKVLLHKNHENQKHNYDKQSKPLAPLEIGDSVRFQQGDKSWKPATVLSKVADRSYVVNAPNGGIYRRNRRHLMKTNEQTYTFDPNLPILAEAQTDDSELSPISPSKSKLPPSSPSKPNFENMSTFQTSNKPYITRSGRVCIPKIKPSM